MMILKQMYNQSDEQVMERWLENPYWQYFTGEVNFQKKLPFDPNDFVHFRKRIGKKGAERILKLSIDIHGKFSKDKAIKVDTTVQEKNITFPTDTKLHKKIIEKCQKIAQDNAIELRQSYKRTLPKLMIQQRMRKHPKTRKKAHAAARKIKTIAGRLVRELQRKLPEEQQIRYKEQFRLYHRVLQQQRTSKNKIYSLHEPDVQCIAKGKESKPYEFGNKSSFALTTGTGIIVGVLSFKGTTVDAINTMLAASAFNFNKWLLRYVNYFFHFILKLVRRIFYPEFSFFFYA